VIDENSYYLRGPDVIAIGTAGHYLWVDPRGTVYELATSCVTDWSMLMQALVVPVSGKSLRRRLAQLPEADADFLASMSDRGLLVRGSDPVDLSAWRDRVLTDNQGYHLRPAEPCCEHLVVALTGSIVAGLMAPVLLSLAYSGYQRQLDVLLTAAALRFITRDLLESYGIRTWVDAFERRDGIHVPHVTLGNAADCVLVMPASASALHRLADAAATDLLSMTVTATSAPVVVVPVMNTKMWNHAGVQRHVRRLRDDGMYVVEPTLIVKAAALVEQGDPMYGGPGPFWRGPLGVMQTLSAAMAHKRKLGAE
jgi:Flavoprotein